MAAILALIEAVSIFLGVGGLPVAWARADMVDGIAVGTALAEGFAFAFCSVIAFYYSGLYDFRLIPNFAKFIHRLPLSFGLALILLAGPYILFLPTKADWIAFVLSLLIAVTLFLLIRAFFYRFMASRTLVKRVLILGNDPLSHRLVNEIESQRPSRYAIIGTVDDGMGSSEIRAWYPLSGTIPHLDRIVEELHPDEIIVGLGDRLGRWYARRLLEYRMRGIPVEDGVEVYERLTGKLAIEWYTPNRLIFSKEFRKSRFDLVMARAISLLAAAAGLVLLAPLFGLIALAIKLDSAGPVFFVHKRMGMGGRPFNLIKFRTMRPAEGESPDWLQDNSDPMTLDRVTRVGKWLRKFRLDELPQLVNILTGDMNLVGPRPHRVSKVELFALVVRNTPENGEEIPYYSLRSMVRPGLTGWAQIRNGYANDLEEEIEKMRYDLYYIKHMSVWFDLYILLETVKVILLGQGSAVKGSVRAPVGEQA